MVDMFLDAGFTYFDTAYIYGGSEAATKKALVERHPRDSYTLCSKLNSHLFKFTELGSKRELVTSMNRAGVEYFDFYLLHALSERNYKKYEDYHLWDFLKDRKAKGQIRHIGFSYHGGPELRPGNLGRQRGCIPDRRCSLGGIGCALRRFGRHPGETFPNLSLLQNRQKRPLPTLVEIPVETDPLFLPGIFPIPEATIDRWIESGIL